MMIIDQTARLQFANWSLDDFSAFSAIAKDPDVMRFIAEGRPWPDSRIGWFMGQQQAFGQTLGYCHWKLIERQSQEMIGFCGLAPLAAIDEVEIGWWLKPNYWGKGLAFEAASNALTLGFEKHRLKRIVARAYLANERSIRLIKRLNLTFERILDCGAAGDIGLFALNAKEHQT